MIQWNARPFQLNKHSLRQLHVEEEFDIALIPETWFKPTHNINFEDFNVIREVRANVFVDVTIVSSKLCPSLNCSTLCDTYGSDHFRIKLVFSDMYLEDITIIPLLEMVHERPNKACKILKPPLASYPIFSMVGKKALRTYKSNLTYDNFLEYKRLAVLCKRTFKTKGKNSWAKFCGSSNTQSCE
nr:unnamed protein product [Callosobruchus analis]